MSTEFNSDQNFEQPEPTHTEQAQKEIEEYIRNAEIGSARFQAFADYTDYQHTDSLLRTFPNDSEAQLERLLINETIRQRKNGVIGYKKKYKYIEALGSKLGESIAIDRKKGVEVMNYDTYLGNIKNRAIDRAADNKNQ